MAARLPCHVIRPYQRNPAFTGRTDILESISAALTPPKETAEHNSIEHSHSGESSIHRQRKMALVGMGGIGKTQVSLRYAFDSLQDFPVILWAHAETRAKLAQSFSEFDEELALSTNTSNQSESRERVKRWLSSAGRFNFAPKCISMEYLTIYEYRCRMVTGV